MSNQVESMDLKEAMAEVLLVSQDDPVRGLFWLASLRLPLPLRVPDALTRGFVDELLALQGQRADSRLHAAFSHEQITAMLGALPSSVSMVFPGASPSSDVVHLTQSVPSGRLKIQPYGDVPTPVEPQAWTVAGLALMAHRYSTPASTQALFPKSAVVDICVQHAGAGGLPPLVVGDASFRRPLAWLAPAFTADGGRVHDVSDLVAEILDRPAIGWLARGMMQHPALDEKAARFVASCWGAQACRLHDLGRFQYETVFLEKNFKPVVHPVSRFSKLVAAIGEMIVAGAVITPALWGRDRYFDQENVPEAHALACAVLGNDEISDAQQVEALEYLRSLGHDVVVAYRNNGKTDAEGPPKAYQCLPLVDAVSVERGQCAIALLQWGADPDARVLSRSGKRAESAREVAATLDFGVIQAHEARRVADAALADLGVRIAL